MGGEATSRSPEDQQAQIAELRSGRSPSRKPPRPILRAAWSQRIERPPEEVFDYVADLDHEVEWVAEASNVVRTTAGEIGVGTTWEEPEVDGVKTIDHYERPREVSFEVSSHLMVERVRFSFLPAGDGATKVSCVEEWTPTNRVGRLTLRLVRRWLRRQMESDRGPKLKEAIERSSGAAAQAPDLEESETEISERPRNSGKAKWWAMEVFASLLSGGLLGGLIGLGIQGETFWSGFILGCIVIAPGFVLIAVVKGRKDGKWPWDV